MAHLAVQILLAVLGYFLARHVFNVFHAYFVSPLRCLPTAHRLILDPFYGIVRAFQRTRHIMVQEAHSQLGPVVRVGPTAVSLADPVLAHRVLKTEDLVKSTIYDALVPPGMVPGVFNARDKEYHRVRRKLHSLSFSLKYLAGLEPAMHSAYEEFEKLTLDKIGSSPEKAVEINALQSFGAIANDVIGLTAFGQSFDSVKLEKEHPFVHHTGRILMSTLLWILFPFTKVRHPLLPATKSLDFVRDFVDRVISERKQLIAQDPSSVPQDILQNLISAQDPDSGKGFTDAEVLAESITLLIAGADTTSTTISWTLYLLSQSPEYIPKLRAELATVPSLTHADLKNLPLLNGILSEGLRLFNVAGGISRTPGPSGFAITLAGRRIVIPEGTEIIIPFWTLHRDPGLWERANEFWPERWFDSDDKEKEGPRRVRRDAWFPFSEGTRYVPQSSRSN